MQNTYISKKNKLLFFFVFLITFVLVTYLMNSLKVTSDMSFFISKNKSYTDGLLQQHLINGDASRLIFIQLSSIKQPYSKADLFKLAQFSKQLKNNLSKNKNFIAVENGQSSKNTLTNHQLFKYRYLLDPRLNYLSNSQSTNIFSSENLQIQFKQLYQRLQMLVSINEQQLISHDPINSWLSYLKSINHSELKKTISFIQLILLIGSLPIKYVIMHNNV